jgi:hypothetical protein
MIGPTPVDPNVSFEHVPFMMALSLRNAMERVQESPCLLRLSNVSIRSDPVHADHPITRVAELLPHNWASAQA